MGSRPTKRYLPHAYLNGCSSTNEILARINGIVPWKTLQPYMDWLADTDPKELHQRKAGRTWEQWRDEQPLHKEFKPANICNFRSEMEYLKNDVMCLNELVEKMGSHMWGRIQG